MDGISRIGSTQTRKNFCNSSKNCGTIKGSRLNSFEVLIRSLPVKVLPRFIELLQKFYDYRNINVDYVEKFFKQRLRYYKKTFKIDI